MAEKPTYEELEQRIKALEQEKLERTMMKEVITRGDKWPTHNIEPKMNPEIHIPDVDLEAIINAEEIQSIMDDFWCLTHMTTAILDLKGNVIEATGWQDICTKFHRTHPKTAHNCTESDLFLAKDLKPGEYADYKCKNGLWDVVTPLYVGTQHLGNIYTGQFFYDDEQIDEEFFIKQAEVYGFDKDSYMDAFRRVPRYNRETVNHLMRFLVKFTTYISKISFVNIQLEKEIRERKQAEAALKESETHLRTLIRTIPDLVWLKDQQGIYLFCNSRFESLFGAKEKDILGKTDYDFVDKELADFFRKHDKVAMAKRKPSINEEEVTFADDGHREILETIKTPMYRSDGQISGVLGIGRNITDRKRAEAARRESESFIKSIMDNLPIGIAVNSVDPVVKFEYMNDNFPQFYRTTRKALADPDAFWTSVYEDPKFREEIKKRVLDDCASGDPERMHWPDVPITRKREGTYYITARNIPVPDKQLMISTVWDVTEQKQIEIRLMESESRFRELFENLYDGVAVYMAENDGNDFRFVDMNKAGQLLSKVKREDIIGKSVTQVFPSVKEIGLFEVFRRVFRTGKIERLPMRQYKDGRISQWVENTVFKLPSGEIVAVYIDESERYFAEETLKENEALLNEVGRIAKIGGWEMDLITRKAKWTQGTYDIVEIDYNQPIPGPDEHVEYYLPEYRFLVSDSMRALIEDDRPLDFEAQLRSAKGNIKWCRAMGRAIKKEGRCIKIYGTFQDITNRKKAEEEIRELNRNLELRVHQRTVQLEEVNKELEDFVYSVSHDLRAPLRSISGFAEIIDRRHKNSLNEEGRHYFDNIVKASRQMGDLIDDLLKFSRLGRKAIKIGNVSLDDVFEAVLKTLSNPIKKTAAQVNIPEKMPVIQGDITLATHIFINLLENAVKYHKPNELPRVDVGFEVEDPYVVVSVADNGIGIEPEYHEKIFNMFQRLHSQADYPGTGIGLAAVKKAVQIMDGRVWVESKPGEGSVFKIKVLLAT